MADRLRDGNEEAGLGFAVRNVTHQGPLESRLEFAGGSTLLCGVSAPMKPWMRKFLATPAWATRPWAQKWNSFVLSPAGAFVFAGIMLVSVLEVTGRSKIASAL